MAPFVPPQTRMSEPMHWQTMPLRTSIGKKGRVVNALMDECAKLCTDETWQRMFAKAARGKLPRGFALRETRLSVKIKKKITATTLSLDPKEALEQFREFVDLYDNIFSEAKNPTPDAEVSVNAFGKNLPHRKHFRRHMLVAFLREEASRLNLSQDVFEEASYTLHTGFALGYFRCKDIVVCSQARFISRVQGFVFSEKTGRFIIHPANFARNPVKKKPPSKKTAPSKDMTAYNFMERARERQVTEAIQHLPAEPTDDMDMGLLLMSLE